MSGRVSDTERRNRAEMMMTALSGMLMLDESGSDRDSDEG
jgi:hypothetical protein